MTEHPTVQDYINRAERNAAYWREEAAHHVGPGPIEIAQDMAEFWDEEADDLRDELTA